MRITRTIAVWGDSVLKGVVFDEVRGTYRLLADSCVNRLERLLGTSITNRTRFGSTVDKGFKQMKRAFESGLEADVILLEYGGNDCDFDWAAVSRDPLADHQPKTPLPQFIETLKKMVALIRERGRIPALMSLPPIDGVRYLDYLVDKGADRTSLLTFLGSAQKIYQYHEWYSLSVTHLARQLDCFYVPIREAFLAQNRPGDLICEDGIHPNEAGHQLMEQIFLSTGLEHKLLKATTP